MNSPMNSPQRQERREFRFPLHLPVLVRTAQRKEMHTRSENISLNGILLSSDLMIPEGSAVEVSIGVEDLADPGILLNARGRVLRVRLKDTGDFAVAIQLDGAFELPLSGSKSRANSQPSRSKVLSFETRKPPSPTVPQNRTIVDREMHFSMAWYTET